MSVLTKECFLDGFVNEYDAIDNDGDESSSSSHAYQTGDEHVPPNDNAPEPTKERALLMKETIYGVETTAMETTATGSTKDCFLDGFINEYDTIDDDD